VDTYPSCSKCSGTRWVRYFSETTDGNLEEAFKLCPCNHEPKTRSERGCENSERVEDTGEGLARPPEESAQSCL
jgi:hypothetical protein